MPKTYLNIVLLFLAVLFFTCEKNDNEIIVIATCDDGVQNGNETGIDCGGSCFKVCPPLNSLSGEIVSTIELFANEEYLLTGPLLIRDGGSLIIQSGAVIKAEKGADKYIAVAQGGNLFVYGREDKPVIMTSNSDNPAPGDWGGIIICGMAPINSANVDRTDLLDIFYGGNNPNDSSGLIQYLRIEYAGANYNDDLNFSSITFYGVGAFTTVNRIQSYMSLGNSFRFVGGTVNAEKLIGLNGYNGISIKDGWNGNLDRLYFANQLNASLKIVNNNQNETVLPVTSGAIQNLSLIGPHTSGAIYYGMGGPEITMNNIYTSGLNLGINVFGSTASEAIDNNLFSIDLIEFDNPFSNFLPTNHNGSNQGFYTLGSATGAGNRGNIPDWAENWTIGF